MGFATRLQRHLESYLELSTHYEEAKVFLAGSRQTHSIATDDRNRNHRLAFFRQLDLIESLEIPYAFHPEENRDRILLARNAAMAEIANWKAALGELYREADREYVSIKAEKPMGPYLKHALALNIRPLMNNLIAFHLTGRDLYAKQAKQNLSGIMHQLKEKRYAALRAFLSFLIFDIKNGPAILE